MTDAERIFEYAKNDMKVKRFFDVDIQNWEDILHINSTYDIIKFMNFVLDNREF